MTGDPIPIDLNEMTDVRFLVSLLCDEITSSLTGHFMCAETLPVRYQAPECSACGNHPFGFIESRGDILSFRSRLNI